MDIKNKEDIILTSIVLRVYAKTRNPFVIANALGIDVIQCNVDLSIMKGSSYCSKAKKEIKLNSHLDYSKQRIVCAHELGHIVLEHTGKSYYKDNNLNREYCANLFAVSLLFDYSSFNCSITEMTNYTLQLILDMNL